MQDDWMKCNRFIATYSKIKNYHSMKFYSCVCIYVWNSQNCNFVIENMENNSMHLQYYRFISMNLSFKSILCVILKHNSISSPFLLFIQFNATFFFVCYSLLSMDDRLLGMKVKIIESNECAKHTIYLNK